MVMNEQKIHCPKCGESISIDSVLTHQIEEKIKKDFEAIQKVKEQEFAQKAEQLKKQADEVAKSQKDIEALVAKKLSEQLAEEKLKIFKEARTEAQREQDAKTALLEEQLKSKDEKLMQATKNEIELRKEKIKLVEDKQAFELDKLRQLEEAKKIIAEEATKKATEEQQYIIAQLKKQLTDATKAKDDLARKLEQGSQQTQGEVLELELENLLRNKFPFDAIEPVPKGEYGGDILHRVTNGSGQHNGTILWETKRTRNWSDGWLSKLRDDQRAAKAEVCVIVSHILPKDVETFEMIDGVWVTHPRAALPIAIILRQSLLEVALARQASEGQQTKTEMIYQYLTGPRFRQRVEAIVEAFSTMQEDLDKERKVIMKQWAKRDEQIMRVMSATVGMYGDLQGIAGKSLQEIAGLEMQALSFQADIEDV